MELSMGEMAASILSTNTESRLDLRSADGQVFQPCSLLYLARGGGKGVQISLAVSGLWWCGGASKVDLDFGLANRADMEIPKLAIFDGCY
jgi:hypothetical protein